ncbi:MAG: DUF2203 domain-containing protein [Nitrospinae bacterium]|nr:DUF2203 domain-containing protein [Nitrospinota bacterium]
MSENKRYFTVEEANRLIPEVTAIVEELRRGQQRLLARRKTAEALAHKARGNGGGGDASTYLGEHAQTFNRGLAQLEAMGVVLKDVERGLLDFPHWREGREVYLCWKLGERRIEYWHDIDAGYAGRQPL